MIVQSYSGISCCCIWNVQHVCALRATRVQQHEVTHEFYKQNCDDIWCQKMQTKQKIASTTWIIVHWILVIKHMLRLPFFVTPSHIAMVAALLEQLVFLNAWFINWNYPLSRKPMQLTMWVWMCVFEVGCSKKRRLRFDVSRGKVEGACALMFTQCTKETFSPWPETRAHT